MPKAALTDKQDMAAGEMSTSRRSPPTVLLMTAFVCSGVSALGFELLWVRLLGFVIGAETLGVLAVLSGFFLGLALGAYGFHRTVLSARSPLQVYARCEVLIACYGLLSPWVLVTVLDRLPRFAGALVGDNQSPVALGVNVVIAAVLLLPATIPMGITTSALVEAWQRAGGSASAAQGVGKLYSANTFGATVGVLGSTYWLLPRFGTWVSVIVLAAICLLAATIVVVYGKRVELSTRPQALDAAGQPGRRVARASYLPLAVTGLAAIGLEATGTQILSQFLENTVYTFANVLAVYLLGTSAGAWLYSRYAGRLERRGSDELTAWLVFGLAVSSFVSTALLGQGPAILSAVAPSGASYERYLLAEVVVAAAVFLLPTLLMGATFSHLLGQFAEDGVGRAYAVNTSAGAVAPIVFGLIVQEYLGLGWAASVVGLLYVGLFLWLSGFARLQLRLAGVALLLGLAAWAHSSQRLVRTPPGYELVAQAQGLHGTVSVSERPFSTGGPSASIRLLQVNQNFLMGGALGYLEKRIGHVAMLLAHQPRDVLFLGVGTGITAATALDYPSVERVQAVELVPEILAMLEWFVDHNRDLQNDPRVSLHASDARRFMRASDQSFDVIVGELFHPTVNGAGALFTREHFLEAKRHLSPDGLFVQWLPLYQLTTRELATIVRTFLDVYPDAHGVLGTFSAEAALGLVGTRGRLLLDMESISSQLGRRSGLRDVIRDEAELLAAYFTDADGLRSFAGDGPLNTDMSQRILFDAPSSLDAETQSKLYSSLNSLLPFRRAYPDELLADPARRVEWRQRVAPTADAVGHFLAAEIARAQAPVTELPSQVLDGYLAAYNADPQMSQAHQMLIESAGRYPSRALTILTAMARKTPADHRLLRAVERVAAAPTADAVREALRTYLTQR